MNAGAPDESPATSELLQLNRWHGFANAAAVALFGVPLINTTTAARAAWVEVSQLVVVLGTRGRKTSHKL
jgi:hypothetical protein